jgi:hypothetical protein
MEEENALARAATLQCNNATQQCNKGMEKFHEDCDKFLFLKDSMFKAPVHFLHINQKEELDTKKIVRAFRCISLSLTEASMKLLHGFVEEDVCSYAIHCLSLVLKCSSGGLYTNAKKFHHWHRQKNKLVHIGTQFLSNMA